MIINVFFAYHLAKNGYHVTVYERAAQASELGYEWEDFFEANTFERAGLPAPETGVIPKVPISFYGPDPGCGAYTICNGQRIAHRFRVLRTAALSEKPPDGGQH